MINKNPSLCINGCYPRYVACPPLTWAEPGHENDGLKNPHLDAERWSVFLWYI